MEGLIPFVYRTLVEHKNTGRQGPLSSWLDESPSASYLRLAGDSGRSQNANLLQSDYGVSVASLPPSREASPRASTSEVIVSTGIESPVSRLTSRRVAGNYGY
ncbi:hypothetical protein CDL15_Pgr000638 [Punica granatum]|uniref:Uncharacterized protein n=1 Tax=Punica granatum TaxID=22663 RepID=A0A218W3H8_PUNGR|nr:hypothetical protein CDL15_Pgr000638 [Punica granatum]PKI72214.1 hypothetical protein CRG98_007412 [Punica granatum]